MNFARLTGLLPRSEFGRNVLTMMTGTMLAQLIPIAVSPILTRLYGPEQFGAFALFLGLASVLSILATGRYDLAVVLPAADEDAANTAALCVALSVVTALLALAVMVAFDSQLTALLQAPGQGGWLWLVPVMVVLLGINQALANWANRRKRYQALAANAIAQNGITAGASIALAFAKALAPGQGLMLGRITGQMSACLILALQVVRDSAWRASRISAAGMRDAAIRHRDFPLYNVPYSFVGAFSKEFLILAFSAFGQFFAAGSWGLARAVLYTPIAFLSSSLGQVFYKEAADHFGTPRLEALANRLMERIIDVFGPAFVFFAWWAPELFALLFGPSWREAGLFAAIFSPAAFLFLFTSWPERIYVVGGRQNLQLCIQLSFDAAIIATLWTMLTAGMPTLSCLAVYTALSVGYHIAYLIGVYRVASFRLSAFWGLLRRMALVLGGMAVVLAGIAALPVRPSVQFGLCAVALAAYYAARAWRERLARA